MSEQPDGERLLQFYASQLRAAGWHVIGPRRTHPSDTRLPPVQPTTPEPPGNMQLFMAAQLRDAGWRVVAPRETEAQPEPWFAVYNWTVAVLFIAFWAIFILLLLLLAGP